MKKIFTRSLLGLVWAIGLFSFPVTTLAQGTDQSVSNLWDVVVRFCNENGQWEPGKMKDLFFEADTNTPYDLCMYVNNNGPTDVDVILNFVDGTITADDSQNKACQPEGTKTNFGQHVDYISEVITVEAWKTVETHGEITFPDGMSWMSYGCVTMMFADEVAEDEEASMFNVLSRRGYFIDALVGWEINLGLDINNQTDLPFGNLVKSNDLVIYKDDLWVYKAKVSVTNPWNIAQEVTVVPTVSALFKEPVSGKNRIVQSIVDDTIVKDYLLEWWDASLDALPETKKVLPNQTVAFEFELNGAFPRWKGPIDVDVILEHTPVFDYVAAEISDDLLEKKTVTMWGSFFVMPWLIIAALIAVILLLLILTTWDKDKKEEKKETKKRTTKKKTK